MKKLVSRRETTKFGRPIYNKGRQLCHTTLRFADKRGTNIWRGSDIKVRELVLGRMLGGNRKGESTH